MSSAQGLCGTRPAGKQMFRDLPKWTTVREAGGPVTGRDSCCPSRRWRWRADRPAGRTAGAESEGLASARMGGLFPSRPMLGGKRSWTRPGTWPMPSPARGRRRRGSARFRPTGPSCCGRPKLLRQAGAAAEAIDARPPLIIVLSLWQGWPWTGATDEHPQGGPTACDLATVGPADGPLRQSAQELATAVKKVVSPTGFEPVTH